MKAREFVEAFVLLMYYVNHEGLKGLASRSVLQKNSESRLTDYH